MAFTGFGGKSMRSLHKDTPGGSQVDLNVFILKEWV